MALKKIFYIIFALFLATGIYSAPDTDRVIKSSVSPEKGSVGQRFIYTLSIAGSQISSVKITLPEKGEYFPQPEKNGGTGKKGKDEKVEEEKIVPLYIINSAAKDTSSSEGMEQVTVTVDLTCYIPGVHQLPEIVLTDSDGVKIGYSIPAVTIGEINKEGKPEDIEPPLELSGNYTRLIILIIAVIAAAIAGFFLYRFLKKRRKNSVSPEPGQTPFEFFKSEIERLGLKAAIDQGRVNDYVFGISISFRRFLSMEFGFDAAEMTTGEISSVIKKYLRSGAVYSDEIVEIMETWDLSKFAEFTLSKEVLNINLDNIVSAAEKISGADRRENG
ncbi:MAG TPA: hypothetical protein PK358_11205 [Spirochaetota bacterium]|nr:hypothetical protein [Spirochaetota bacterium]HPJ35395.1 hypothetical protein [Spirochaetota bacterium]